MSICMKCGTNAEADAGVCAFCGAPVGEETQGTTAEKAVSSENHTETAAESAAPQSENAGVIGLIPPAEPFQKRQTPPAPADPTDARPLSVWDFAWSLFVMLLPAVGLAAALFWAFGGTYRVNRRNLARGMLAAWFAVTVIFVAVHLCAGPQIADMLRGMHGWRYR